MSKNISRRQFVRDTSRTAIGMGVLLGSGGVALATPAGQKSKVIRVEHGRVIDDARVIDAQAVRLMVRRGMEALTGSPKPFQRLFSPTDRVGVKINCLGKRTLHTHPEVVDAFVAELTAAGVKADNIVVWDRFEDHMKRSGYAIKATGKGVRYLGTESRSDPISRFDPKARHIFGKDDTDASRLSNIFTNECNKQINLSILKDHGLAGVTLTLKNIAFGVCDNNSRFHGREKIGPFIADFCARPDVRERFVLHVIDAIEGCFDGGPAPTGQDTIFRPGVLFLGHDPVALDTLGAQLIDAKRKEKGYPSLAVDGRPPDHIRLAALRGVGVDDLAKIDLVEVRSG